MLNELTVQTGVPVPHLSVTMAMAVIAIVPVMFAFLLVQKYFVRGITLGSIKGD
jgi:putative aldouronate transport system permease protein